jgi:beta-glucosidase
MLEANLPLKGPCVGNTGSVPRFGIPDLCLQDGPLGVRATDYNTAFPAGITVGATWNTTAMRLRGIALGQEFRGKGVNILLGPVVGPLGRKPAGGRNWEGFGADPYLQGTAAFETITGQQSTGVISTVKHFIGNEQETFREQLLFPGYSSNIDDRTLHELYLWPFADAVRAGVGAVMSSYNQVNNSYASQNSYLLNFILKNELGFQGFVMSDWYGQRAGVDAILAGLDMSMPGEQSVSEIIGCAGGELLPCGAGTGIPWFASQLTTAVLNGSVPQDRLDDAATRILAAYYQMNQSSGYPPPNFSANTLSDTGKPYPGSLLSFLEPTVTVNKHVQVNTSEHAKLARDIAAEAVTLLKNDNFVLPLSTNAKLAIFGTDAFPNPNGPNSCDLMQCDSGVLGMGWGSGSASYPYLTDPASRIKARATNTAFYNTDTFPKSGVDSSDTTALVFINSDSGELTNPLGFLSNEPTEVEGSTGDRLNLYAWHNGDTLVQNVASQFGSVIVVVHTVGPINMENWIEHPNVTAVLVAHLPGQEAGDSIADVLFGDVNPSGHLPYSVVRNGSVYPPSTDILAPVIPIPPQIQDTFSEGLYIDYRYLNAFNITPRFAFGHGLSYTTFAINTPQIIRFTELTTTPPAVATQSQPSAPVYSTQSQASMVSSASFPFLFPAVNGYLYSWVVGSASAIKKGTYPYPKGYSASPQKPLSPAAGGQGGNPALWDTMFNFTVPVTNTGNRTGQIVTQLYVQFPPGIEFDTPPIQLRGFQKKELEPGATGNAIFLLTRKDLSVWDTTRQNWIIPETEGEGYTIWFGQSSDALTRQCNTATLKCQ